jgi:prepilin-type N-terminal cleavage/methylation domain-containing protein/prepilin-type processing-associated H-X9-DG protein
VELSKQLLFGDLSRNHFHSSNPIQQSKKVFPFKTTSMIRDRAFTLIELLAVMVILGVLMTVLAPAALAVRRHTTLATSSSALRQLSIAAQSYLFENNGKFFTSRERLPDGDQWWFGFEGFNGPKTEGQRVLDKSRGPLGPYIANSAGTVPDFAFTSMGSSFKPKFKNGYFGFGVNTELTGGPTGQQTSKLRQVNQLERPGQIALFATCAQINTFQAPASGKNPMLEEFYFFNTTDCANTIHFRHAGNAIIAFADGSQREVSGNRASFNSRLPSACVGRLPATMILP